ncbi:hypothetical protein ABB37_01412 [Leptomonas pyrrhocoris]|uniref:B box-type domain-containing protein n=1 Tax=Leptomonas pyrrhocoris TaxID=157538 RepID=A0A0M9G8Y5_LEPPY|nr:hypothetical protein ABB37_01412 [Leptomonas pyrrhocoris]KPA84976.1 hypothetical protein ABB37_01412 [Leptomonas pyrrhocoris]|eukprot:XP_015663415.1 hypothetical protein ABB37_01412 [Leptomonas pyrrhocoris]
MSSALSPSSNTYVRLVVYCDEEPDPLTLPDVPLPHHVESLRRFVEDKVGKRAKLLSYWNYAHNRYELLRDVRELLQEDGRILSSSPPRSRPQSRVRGGARDEADEEGAHDSATSRSGRSSGRSATGHPPHVYRGQLWLETVLLQLEPLDARRDAAEYDELRRHVARWLGNKHVGYEVHDAVRVRCPFLTRMFDETRSTRLEGSRDKVQLLYYSNNAWSVRDVLQYGFLLDREVPRSMAAVVHAQSGGSDISTTSDTRLSIPVPTNAQAASSSRQAAPVEDVFDSQAHPFIFTSSMLGPNVKHPPACAVPHKVLLCEVAPGRRFMMDQSLTGEPTGRRSSPQPIVKAPPGYDSVCYMRTRDDRVSVKSGDAASAMAEDISIVQVQVGHSYQALPRYLLTVAPTGGPPSRLPFFDSTVSATASPVRAPGSTAAAAAAREDAEKRHASAAASQSGQLKEWWPSSPFRSPQKRSEKNTSTPIRPPRSLSASPDSLPITPRTAYGSRGSVSGNTNASRGAYTTPRRAASAAAAPHPDLDAADRDYDYVSGGSGAVAPSRAHSQPRPHPNASLPVSHREDRFGDSGGGSFGGVRPAQNSPWGAASPSAVNRMPGGLSPPVNGFNGGSPSREALQGSGPRVDSAVRASPRRLSRPRAGGDPGFDPPTPPLPARGDANQNARSGLLYSGLQAATKNHNNISRSDFSLSPQRWALPSVQNPHNASIAGSSAPLNRSGTSRYGPTEWSSAHPLIPAFHVSADHHHNSNSSGERVVPLPGPLPSPSSIMRRSSSSVGASPRLPPAAPPPAAFNQFLCTIHPRQLQSLYCTACAELTCPYCASIGAHREHVVVEAADQVPAVHAEVHKLYEELRHWLSEYRHTEEKLRSEHASQLARQQREFRTLQQNFQALKQTLQQTERNMTQTVQQRTCPPPFAEASAVIGKYAQALAPISAALTRYHNAQDNTNTSLSQAPPGPPNVANGGRGATRSIPEMLHFLRTAPPLVRRVEESFAQHHQEEERRLRDGIASYHARADAVEGVYDHVDWVGLKRLLEHLGSSRSTRGVKDSASRERSPRRESSALSFFDGVADGSTESAVRVRGRNSARSSPLSSRLVRFDSGDVSRRLLPGRSPVRQLAVGDDLASCVSHRTSPPPSTKQDRLLLRCLEDLQRGHIWAIQDASSYFAPGQLKAVCSTSFRLLGAQWELRLAPLPPSYRTQQRRNSAPASSSSLLVAPGMNAGMMATTASTWLPTILDGNGDCSAAPAVAHSPLATQSVLDADGRAGPDTVVGGRRSAPEEEWLGLFVFPLQHRLRMDFRVIAFSEVTWAEWQVTGWPTEMAGKGWGLYPFLQRKELMRTDKLARDNTVKICVAPISDLY